MTQGNQPETALPIGRPVATSSGRLVSTRIEREHFLIHAPLQWVEVPGEKPTEFEFRNQTLPEQLIVTVWAPRECSTPGKMHHAADFFVKHRLSALATISKGQAIHSPPRFQSGNGQLEARCVGHDAAQSVRFAFAVRVAPAKVITVGLTRYTLVELGPPFEVHADLIFDLLQVKNPTVAPNATARPHE